MNYFGRVFRITLFGESHGHSVGVVLDGVPPGIKVSDEELSGELERRRAGARGTTPRKEDDAPEWLSGIFKGCTTGAPVTVVTRNRNIRSDDYYGFRNQPRPGHADFSSMVKFGGNTDYRGGGHFSGRLTWGLVVAGYFARKIAGQVSINASIISAGGSPDIDASVERAVESGDSIGAIIECVASDVPAGLGEPFFYSAESALSSLLFSIPAVKGVEFGSGFAAAGMTGSQHNDPIVDVSGKTLTNNAGGINGGITNGNDLVVRIAVKPASSIASLQKSVDLSSGEISELRIGGRHDTLIALRMPVIVESAVAAVIADLIMVDRAIHFKERGKG